MLVVIPVNIVPKDAMIANIRWLLMQLIVFNVLVGFIKLILINHLVKYAYLVMLMIAIFANLLLPFTVLAVILVLTRLIPASSVNYSRL